MKAKRGFRLDFWKIIIILVFALLIGGFSIIFGAIRHKVKIDTVFNQITACVGSRDITMFGEYNGQTVKIANENRDVIWNAVTDKNILFSTADKIPTTEPVIIRFDNKLELVIYPMEDNNVFVKYGAGKKTTYYIIDGTCNFTFLKKMVSLEGWYAPNNKYSHLGGKLSD